MDEIAWLWRQLEETEKKSKSWPKWMAQREALGNKLTAGSAEKERIKTSGAHDSTGKKLKK